jgi:hypothetical protein
MSLYGHACGEFVLDLLQRGKTPAEVAQQLLSNYLVLATPQRLSAYRLYREQTGNYWSLATLEPLHWKSLYDLVSLDYSVGHFRLRGDSRPALRERLLSMRTAFCAKVAMAEDGYEHLHIWL